MFGQMIDDTTLHIAICHAANTALTVLNKYYSFTDDSTVSKLHNQLSEDSAHAAVMVGQWAGNPDLIAAKEFDEAQLIEGWSRKKKRKADVPAEGQSAPKCWPNLARLAP
ncbi:hypothetical protein B0H17DRAFT_1135385 [Mycena rosella]|uniref:Uncharacterized protein n=1 Tax=Mycena rosella TaxID=1033263 RepID=A0AAD7DDR6_MYCRO|nr:hypothetical protein B0H17DRAFT_1135385 [Mycena rosella]